MAKTSSPNVRVYERKILWYEYLTNISMNDKKQEKKKRKNSKRRRNSSRFTIKQTYGAARLIGRLSHTLPNHSVPLRNRK